VRTMRASAFVRDPLRNLEAWRAGRPERKPHDG